MIDHALVISPTAMFVFQLKLGFWLYGWPMIVGFLTILGYQTLARTASMGAVKWPVIFILGGAVSMFSLFGWTMMIRRMGMIPFYGCGVGLASAMMSRVYAVITPMHPRLKIRVLRVIWRGDANGIEQLRQGLRVLQPKPGPGNHLQLGYNPLLNPLER